MEAREPNKVGRQLKISAHLCKQCGFSIDLKDLGLREGATGLVTCPKCGWSGQVTIRIVPRN